jgi:Uma2 family endonuclease
MVPVPAAGYTQVYDRPVIGPSRIHRYTYADYVGVELTSTTKHEFLGGEIYALTAGSEEHSGLCAQILRLLGNAIAERPTCRVHTSDLRVYVESVGLATFPDGSVICGALVQHPPSPQSTALNPLVLVEVTSDSSEDYDTGFKLEAYRSIPSLAEYIVVSHRERRITVHHRSSGADGVGDRGWTVTVGVAGGVVEARSLGTTLSIDEVYRSSAIR